MVAKVARMLASLYRAQGIKEQIEYERHFKFIYRKLTRLKKVSEGKASHHAE